MIVSGSALRVNGGFVMVLCTAFLVTPAIGIAQGHALGIGRDLLEKSAKAATPDLPLLPWPKQVTRESGAIEFTGPVIVAKSELAAVGAALASALQAVIGRKVETLPGDATIAAPDGSLELALDPELADEEYQLAVDRRVRITGGSARAVAFGGAALVQLLGTEGAAGGTRRSQVPRVVLRDRPDCEYRGLLVDVARHWHSVATLKRLIELCWLYRINYLQLHLTDDQSFTFPSTAFPALATPGRSYKLDELKELEAWSQARGVTIVPELDMPGHCGAAIAAMPELLRASTKHHATIDFAKPAVVAAMVTLMDELLAVFRATPWFHIGGDEADLEFVHENPDFQAAFAREKVANAQELYCWFLGRMNDAVKQRGRRMLVWEGFGHDARPAIPTDVTVMVYESAYHLPDCLVRDGYPVINASWEPLYVVNDRKWEPAEIHAWDRFYWKHFLEGFPAYHGLRIEKTARVIGAQLCSWEQPEEIELSSLRQRLAAMSERVWNPDAGRGFDDFSARLALTDQRLDLLLSPLR